MTSAMHLSGFISSRRLVGRRVEPELFGCGVTLKLLWEEWRAGRAGGMSYPTPVPPVPPA